MWYVNNRIMTFNVVMNLKHRGTATPVLDQVLSNAEHGKPGFVSDGEESALGIEYAVSSGTACAKHGRCLDEVSLYKIHTDIAKPVEIFLMLDLLGDNLELHRARELDHRRNHLLVDEICLQISRVSAVDLQIVYRQVLEARERTKTAAEIIERKLAADTMQHLDETLRLLDIRQNSRLGHLETDR